MSQFKNKTLLITGGTGSFGIGAFFCIILKYGSNWCLSGNFYLFNMKDLSLRNHLLQYYKKAQKYLNYFSFDNKLKYIYIGIALSIKR